MAHLAALMHPTLHGERGSLQRHQWVDYLDTLRDLVLPLELLVAWSSLFLCLEGETLVPWTDCTP